MRLRKELLYISLPLQFVTPGSTMSNDPQPLIEEQGARSITPAVQGIDETKFMF
jgi:hypothetical protein